VAKNPSLSRENAILTSLNDVSPIDLAKSSAAIRRYFSALQFDEVTLGPFDAYPIDYGGEVIDVAGVGQLRFNTEPEIWTARGDSKRFFSISDLFRRESEINLLRRVNFIIVDFYQPGSGVEELLGVFGELLKHLQRHGYVGRLADLKSSVGEYDPVEDAPRLDSPDTGWVVTRGYDAAHSFFEVDDSGASTRNELFLVTPWGHLEIGAMGIAGWNRNPAYALRDGRTHLCPPLALWGMGFGLERLLLAEQILGILNKSRI